MQQGSAENITVLGGLLVLPKLHGAARGGETKLLSLLAVLATVQLSK